MSDGEPLLLLRVCTLPVETLAPFAADRASEAVTGMLASEAELDRLSEALAGALHREAGAAPADDSEWARARHALLRLRRDVHNRRALEPDALGLAHSRLSPGTAEALADWERTRISVDEARAHFRTAYAGDRERAWTALSAWTRDDRFQEGLRLVSGSLLGKVERLANDPPADWGHRERHAALKALAYLARFATKTSPNGVFCVTALATWCDRARCEGENRLNRLVYLLSVAEARKISACLAATTEVEPAIVPRANPSLRATDGTWTFWKPASPRHPDDDDVLTRIKQNPVAQAFLDEASELPVSDLLERVGARCCFASGSPELRAFFDRLVAHGLLIAEIEVPYRSPRPLRELASAIATHAAPSWLSAVEAIEESVDGLADEPWSARRFQLDRLERELESLPHRRPLHGDELFKVDAATELAVSLPRSLIAELESFLHGYARLYAALYPERLFRAAYARRFLERFPSDVEVEALDLYHGVFEPQDLARPWGFPEPPGTGPIADACRRKFARVRDAVANAARDAEAQGHDEIALDRLDWDSLLDRAPEPSWSCGLLFQVAAASADDVTADHYRLIVSAIYPGTGLASARLAHLHARDGVDPITDELRRASHAIERDGTVVAEITYMHGGRTANAGLRPTVVPREIELPGDRRSPGVESFPLRDLTVRYDSSRERFVLRSRSRGQELRPVLSSGISPEGFVSFLLAIGRQDLQQPLGSFPGFEAPGIRRWPRMRWGQVIVFRRRWDLPIAELRAMRTSRDGAAAFESVQRWRAREDVPRRVFVASSRAPKPYFVDLESPPFLELLDHQALAATAAADEVLHVTEMLPGPERSWVNDAHGRYASEFLVHLQNVAAEPRHADSGLHS